MAHVDIHTRTPSTELASFFTTGIRPSLSGASRRRRLGPPSMIVRQWVVHFTGGGYKGTARRNTFNLSEPILASHKLFHCDSAPARHRQVSAGSGGFWATSSGPTSPHIRLLKCQRYERREP